MWALEECKRALNNRGEEGREPEEMQSLGLAGIRFSVPAQEHEDARAASAEDSMDNAERRNAAGDAFELTVGGFGRREEAQKTPTEDKQAASAENSMDAAERRSAAGDGSEVTERRRRKRRRRRRKRQNTNKSPRAQTLRMTLHIEDRSCRRCRTICTEVISTGCLGLRSET